MFINLKFFNQPGNKKNNGNEEKGDNKKVVFLFLYFLLVAASSMVGRTAADAFFLSHFNTSLSYMYLPVSVSLVLSGFIFQKIADRYKPRKLTCIFIPVIIVLILITRIIIGFGFSWIYPGIYIGYDVFNFFLLMCLWTFTLSVLDTREAKQLIGTLGAGGILGGILGGLGVRLLASFIGMENLIFIYAALIFLSFIVFNAAARNVTTENADFASASAKTGSVKSKNIQVKVAIKDLLKRIPYLKYLVIITFTIIVSQTLIDYQFKSMLSRTFTDADIANFLGNFYICTGFITLFFQYFLSGKIIFKYGVVISFLILPGFLFISSVGILFCPILATSMLAKGSDRIFSNSIYSSINQLMFFPISEELKGAAKGFIDGVVHNGSKVIAAILLIILSGLIPLSQISIIVLVLLCVSFVSIGRLKDEYIKLLKLSLETRRIKFNNTDISLIDSSSIDTIRM